MLKTLICRYEKGVFKANCALPREFDRRNILVVLNVPENEPPNERKLGERFCGAWRDDRPADAIVREIKSHRRPLCRV